MKRLLLYTFALASTAHGQMVSDMVSLGAGYTNESYYSFANGEVANVNDLNWDLAFDLSTYGAAVRLNRRKATLYVYPGSIADWSTVDTAGMASWDQYINGYDEWSEGAVNRAADPADGFDMGWGDYNSVTHQIIGSRIFILEYTSGEYKKFAVESLISGAYNIRHADLDGSNEVTEAIAKSAYSGLNFVHYDLLNSQIVEREPASDTWDIVFTNYVLELAPGYFSGVTSTLQNYNTYVSRIAGVPSASATYNVWDTTIETIGYDWKTFNMSTFSYDIEDSLTYFVQTASSDVWKMVFTGFDGSSNGNIYFNFEQVEYAGLPVYEGANLSVYPNPANEMIRVDFAHEMSSVKLIAMNGQEVYGTEVAGMNQWDVQTDTLESGVYFLQVSDASGRTATQKVMISH